MAKRAAIVMFYDKVGIVDDYFTAYLEGIRPYVDHLVVVVNGTITQGYEAKLHPADEVLYRKNIGFDVAAYVHGLQHLQWGYEFDEVLMTNHTQFGPIGSFETVFTWAKWSDYDFWGMSAHPGGYGVPDQPKHFYVPYHIQSHWMAIKTRILTNTVIGYLVNVAQYTNNYDASVLYFEHRFAEFLMENGFTVGAMFTPEIGVGSATLDNAEYFLRQGMPILKRRLFFNNPPFIRIGSAKCDKVFNYAESTGYNTELIKQSISRALNS